MKTPRIVTSIAAIAVAAVMTGCTALGVTGTAGTSATSGAATALMGTAGITVTQVLAENGTVDAADTSYDAGTAVKVELTGTSARAAGDGVTVSGATVTITAPGTYVLTGTLNGQVVVNSAADGEVRIVLAGATVTSATGPAMTFAAASEAVVVLADGTTNALTDAAQYSDQADGAPNAALYSKADLTIGGGGMLTVTGRFADGITSKDGLVVAGGTITVTAVDDGVRGKDHVVVTGGTLTVTAGGDGLKSDNETEADSGFVAVLGGSVALTTGGDGVDAATDAVVGGGTLTVTAGGGAGSQPSDATSTKGIKAGTNLAVGGGTMTVDASDDALHSNSVVSLTGGDMTLASGDDGVHAEDALTIADGTLTVTRSYEGLESGHILISGGTSEVTSSDDALNVSASATSTTTGRGMDAVIDGEVTVTGGTLILHAMGDGFDSNGSASITGGTVVVDGPTMNGNGALDVNGAFTISGGTLVALGSSGMAEAPDTSSTQGWLQAAISGQAGATVRISSGSTVVAEFTAYKAFANVVYSSPEVTNGQQYTVATGSASTTVTAGTATGGGMGGPRR